EHVFISGGFADVNNNVMSVLAESAEKAADIDTARAQSAKERAEKRLAARDDKVDTVRAESSLQRAITRLQIARG
ncbi:MAG: F0F1 ATP synthase subunit epsilon, partial [Desulfovibrio sp.]|nr:F0F1 ATP synthase subunit epsilon [Desulfovibrio sp.]